MTTALFVNLVCAIVTLVGIVAILVSGFLARRNVTAIRDATRPVRSYADEVTHLLSKLPPPSAGRAAIDEALVRMEKEVEENRVSSNRKLDEIEKSTLNAKRAFIVGASLVALGFVLKVVALFF